MPEATSGNSSDAFSVLHACSATRSIFQMIAVAPATRLYRREASVRKRTEAKGDSTMVVVRRCRQCSRGNA